MTHKQTFNRQACATKKEAPILLFELSISLCTLTVNRFHGRIPWQRFLKSLEPAANGNGLLSGFLSGNRKPPLTVRVIERGYREKILNNIIVEELRCQGSLARTVVCGNQFEGGRAATFDFPASDHLLCAPENDNFQLGIVTAMTSNFTFGAYAYPQHNLSPLSHVDTEGHTH